MQTILAALLSLVFAASLSIGTALADKKVALVIGNGAYKNVVDLPNAPNDARDMGEALRTLGFLVVEGTDLTHNGMHEKMREFGRALVGADLGLFFYAGHGMQVGGENYLVPIGSTIKREADLEFEAIKVETVIRQLSREAKIKIVILDSCRDNPIAAELARSMASSPQSRTRSGTVSAGMGAMDAQSVSGTMIAFATAPGTVALDGTGRNSPFTEALLANISTSDIDVDLMMKRVRGQVTRSTGERQQPWTNSSLTAEYYLNPSSGGSAQRVASLPPTTSAAASGGSAQSGAERSTSSSFDPRQMEFEFWRAAQSSNRVGEYNAYLQQFPQGTFAEIARSRVAALSSGALSSGAPAAGSRTAGTGIAATSGPGSVQDEASESGESELNLNTSDWRELQRKLTSLGFSTKGADGKPGDATRKAVRDWQGSQKLGSTGYFNSAQLQALRSQSVPVKAAAKDDDDEEEVVRKPRSQPTTRSTTSNRTTSSDSPRRNGGGSGGSIDSSAAVVGGLLAIGAGVAIGRGLRRR